MDLVFSNTSSGAASDNTETSPSSERGIGGVKITSSPDRKLTSDGRTTNNDVSGGGKRKATKSKPGPPKEKKELSDSSSKSIPTDTKAKAGKGRWKSRRFQSMILTKAQAVKMQKDLSSRGVIK